LAATVESLIDDDRILVRLWIKISLEVFVAAAGCVGNVNVGDSAPGSFCVLAASVHELI
jgi:hypothetical protein